MDIYVIVNQLGQLFLMMGLGFCLGKIKVLKEEITNELAKLVVNVTMPLLIIGSVINGNRQYPLALRDVLIATVILTIVLPLFAYLIGEVDILRDDKFLYRFMIMYPNVGFMGFPLMLAIYGTNAVLPLAIINMGFNISLFTIGKLTIQGRSEDGVKLDLRMFSTPGILASLGSIIIYAYGVSVPDLLASPVNSIGSMTTPLAMIIIGATLAKYDLKSIFWDVKTYVFTIFNGIMIPLLFSPLLNHLIIDDIVYGISIIILAMPVANSASLFANTYGANELLATKTVLITTLFSIITIPITVVVLII